MSCHSNIYPYDVILANINGQNHYFVCIYTQLIDNANRLTNDIYGLVISTNKKYEHIFENHYNDYNAKIKINGKDAYVCCDKLTRISTRQERIILKHISLTENEKEDIKKYLKKFLQEVKRQTGVIK